MRKNYFFKKLCLTAFCSLSFGAFAQETFTNGIFVLNEGGAGSINASVSFLQADGTVNTNIFAQANPNQGAMGDTAQSLSFEGENAYIVLNISNTVQIVNKETFTHIATISSGLSNPRYMAFYNGNAYITNWGDGGNATDDYIAVLNLETNTITQNIPVAEGVERIITHNGKLYAAHKGGYGYGNTVSVINPVTNTLETILNVGDVPNKLLIKDNFLYVLCGGKPSWSGGETDGALVKIDLSDNSTVATTALAGLHPENLNIDSENHLYFSSDAQIYSTTLTNPSEYTQIITLNPQGVYGIYGMDVIDNKIYVADAGNYVTAGKAYVFSTTGEQISNYTVGVIPNSFYKAESNLSAPVFSQNSIVLYPNPASDRFFINTNSTPEVTVTDISGKQILKTLYTTAGINVSALPKGIYIVGISDDANVTFKKLVIK